MEITITLSNDGYGTEVEGAELEAVHSAFQDYVAERVQSAYPDANVNVHGDGLGETKFEVLGGAQYVSRGDIRAIFDEAWEDWCSDGWTAWARVRTIKAQAVNDLAREMMRSGFTLTHDEADEIGDEGRDWLSNRLGLRVTETDRGVECQPSSDNEPSISVLVDGKVVTAYEPA